MKCRNCGHDNYKVVYSRDSRKRIECNKCSFRSTIFTDPVAEMKSCIAMVNSGMDLEDFLYNINKEKE